jgi:hypothetical protein
MRNFKLVSAVALFVCLTGCTTDERQDTVQVTPSQEKIKDAAVVRAASDPTVLRGIISTSGSEGWMTDDSIQTYTLRSTKHNTYRLTEGEGDKTALFSLINGADSYEDAGTIYALTSCNYLYGISATAKKQAKVSITIPNSYPHQEIAAPEGRLRMPVPYWGTVEFASDGKLETTLTGLTALLKLDAVTLPSETRAIVLTTHAFAKIDDVPLEDGEEEPLSGTFDAELTDGAQLVGNPIFYTYDSLRVNVDMNAAQFHHLFIPVVANTYPALHVIAVTGDNRAPYSWKGKVLKTFKSNTTFKPNTIVSLEQESTGIKSPTI